MPSARNEVGGALTEKIPPPLMPRYKGSGKVLLVYTRQWTYQVLELLSRRQFGFSREVFSNYCLLVEVAHLHGQIRKEWLQTRLSVGNYCKEFEAH